MKLEKKCNERESNLGTIFESETRKRITFKHVEHVN